MDKVQEENVDLTKSLDESLENLETIKKSESKKDFDVKEYMKNPENVKKMKKYMKEHDEDSEGADEDKMKKSFEDAVEENESVIDAVPVLKAFSKTLSKVVDKVSEISEQVSIIKSSNEESSEFQKSLIELNKSQNEIIKSLNETVDAFGETAPAPKGVQTELIKSEDKKDNTLLKSQIQEALFQGMEEGKVSSNSISQWEMSNYRFSTLPSNEQAYVMNKINGGK